MTLPVTSSSNREYVSSEECKRLKHILLDADMSIADFAKSIDRSRTYISGMLNGHSMYPRQQWVIDEIMLLKCQKTPAVT